MHGTPLPVGLVESDRLDTPVFTPSTKADEGHDINISFDEAVELVGGELAERARDVSLELYTRGAAYAAERGIIIADTKFEMGLVDGELVLADEVLTPDSSRFWPADQWTPGSTPPSFDKQPVRDFLDGLDWDKTPPPPALARRGRRRLHPPLHRGLRTHHRPLARRLAGGLSALRRVEECRDELRRRRGRTASSGHLRSGRFDRGAVPPRARASTACRGSGSARASTSWSTRPTRTRRGRRWSTSVTAF